MAPETASTTLAFVCVQNAGRSQMAYAFAERERAERNLTGEIGLITGGTEPADEVHSGVVAAMRDVAIDIGDRTPREVTFEEIKRGDYVITMGCAAEDVCPAGWAGENRDWSLDDPDGSSPAQVVKIRDEIEDRVSDLFDEITDN